MGNRLIQTIGMMDAANENEAMVAFRGATRMLAAQGMTWRTVADRMAQITPAPAAPSPSAFDSAFGDIFRGFTSQRAEPQRREPPKPRRVRMEGIVVPREIAGSVHVSFHRNPLTGKQEMLALEIQNETAIYAALVAFDATVIAELNRAAKSGLNVIARVRPPRREGHMPTVTSVVVVGG